MDLVRGTQPQEVNTISQPQQYVVNCGVGVARDQYTQTQPYGQLHESYYGRSFP